MSTINRILTYALGLFLISAGVAKFTGGHVFQYIEHRSGIDVFYPYVNHATGAAEIVIGLLIMWPATRRLGGLLAAGLMAGAAQRSPWCRAEWTAALRPSTPSLR